ncbi:retinol dehydrogenase 8 [Ophiostoma piceae UAMH 11346]|uniref:Retinol dehydrogenase 8 n=1 Tax=Ophiostoma piceae (strain UAMH 11346) TaxID=1262450 RepID=S3CLS4_OPHP1|nr:retinol dehydrogenase 8 [Ophiostoma piceae UAMH 11346]
MDDRMDSYGAPDPAETNSDNDSSVPIPEPGHGDRSKSECATPGGGKTGKKAGAGKGRLQLPASCVPPQTAFPARHLVWIVYGGTGHMGRSLVKSALAHGDNVTMVGRTNETTQVAMERLAESIQAAAEESIRSQLAASQSASQSPQSSPKAGQCFGTLCDVRIRESVDLVVQQTQAQFGRIDVVANCSGYGVVGSCEDQDDYELRNQFRTNFMGTLHILQATLPIFRQQRSDIMSAREDGQDEKDDEPNGGRYLIFSSTSGALGVPGLGPYCATKYAVEGLIEAMLYEVDAFDIKATLVEPGLLRRDDAVTRGNVEDDGGGGNNGTGGTIQGMEGLPTWGHFLIKPPSEPYASRSAPARHTMRMVQWLGDRQPTSVVQCAEIVWQLAHCKFPPLRLPLGSYAIESIRDRLRSVTEELDDWRHLNFPLPPEVIRGTSTTPGSATATTAPSMPLLGAGTSAGVDDDEEMAD